jgi:hypothetical protein
MGRCIAGMAICLFIDTAMQVECRNQSIGPKAESAFRLVPMLIQSVRSSLVGPTGRMAI